MIDAIINASRSDTHLAVLVDEAREYAQVYLLAKQRHKGCSGTGELMTLKEEFKDTIERLARYCGGKGYPCDMNTNDPDTAALELTRR